jgi:serine/threonine protein kinase
LLDFGAVKPAADESGSGRKRVFVGTREYAPPEQWEERAVPASDVYALGGTLFHALIGHPPFEVPDRDANEFRRVHAHAPIPKVRTLNPSVPTALSRLIGRMLAKRPEDRGSPAELIEAFRSLLPPEEREPVLPTTLPPRIQRPARPAAARAPDSETPAPAPPEPDRPARDPLPRAVNVVLGVFEQIYLPPHLRPAAGSEPPLPERIAVLLRRPLVILTIIVLIGALIVLLV